MISVIIPTYKEPDVLDICLQSIFEGQEEENEIIVVVDGFYEINKPILNKYPKIKIVPFPDNKGAITATNWGVYNALNDFILVANDDNVFPQNWDTKLKPYCQKGKVITINQIEAQPSMFIQTHTKDLGTPETFDLNTFWEYESSISILPPEKSGSQWPFLMYKADYMAVGGLDVYYPSPHVVDWDFMLKCEYFGFEMIRIYDLHLYHFVSIATRREPDMNQYSTEKEIQAHQFFKLKWGSKAEHNPQNNSKLLSKFK
jgi:glycosyltransferase involved in cell wall biosynthesis